MLPNSEGIEPLSLLPLRFNVVRLESLANSEGMDPVRLLLPLLRDSLKFPLPVIPKDVSASRSPNFAGNAPVRSPSWLSRKPLTRSGEPETLTPCQYSTLVIAAFSLQPR